MKIIFGSIVTNGAGSIGGQFIKRIRGGHSLNNKPSRASLNILLKNSALPFLSVIFKMWATFTLAERIIWNDLAALYQYPDQFGNPKHLTGRQFFTKHQAVISSISNDLVDPLTYSTALYFEKFTFDFWNQISGELWFNHGEYLASQRVIIRIDKLKNSSIEPHFVNSKNLGFVTLVGAGTVDLGDYFNQKFPYASTGQTYQLSTVSVNDWGVLSVPDVTVFTLV
jgi:hypothetical protein